MNDLKLLYLKEMQDNQKHARVNRQFTKTRDKRDINSEKLPQTDQKITNNTLLLVNYKLLFIDNQL